MVARANVTEFINQINAKPGYSASVNADGSVAISKNGILVRPRVLWNVMWGTVSVGWIPGNGANELSDSPKALEPFYGSSYPVDSVTFVDGGTATTAAAQFFLDGLN